MPSVDDRLDLAPRAEPGVLRSFGLALLVHLLLLSALTWGVSWKSKDTSLSFEAELWSALPQEAAPPLEAPPTPPEPVAPPAPPPLRHRPRPKPYPMQTLPLSARKSAWPKKKRKPKPWLKKLKKPKK